MPTEEERRAQPCEECVSFTHAAALDIETTAGFIRDGACIAGDKLRAEARRMAKASYELLKALGMA